MRIKRLEVMGFKSFCDRSVLSFHEPITGVVGPNGCGKSNIVDAIRWCMGEQSAKHLRGKAMDDVIFSGSDSRGPSGMCEVTLVFDNDGNVPIEYMAYSEISVTRKLYRDGTSEYYLNKTPCRLRDISDFFMGTGIGTKAYSIIEQGRVGMIVSSKPEDRRFLIEEAAGITKYKVKKKAAEKKMDGTRQNLLRVSDVVAEIEKQLASLRRQAQKAERYREYRAELRDLELWSAAQRFLGFLAEDQVAALGLADTVEKRDQAEHALELRQTRIEALRIELASEEERIARLQEELYALDNRIRLAEAENDHARRERDDLSAREDAERTEIDELGEKLELDRMELARLSEERELLERTVGEQRAILAGREAVLTEARQVKTALDSKLDDSRRRESQEKSDIARQESELTAAGRRRDDLQLRAGRHADEEGRVVTRSEELKGELRRKETELADLRQLKLGLVEEKERAHARHEELTSLDKGRAAEVDSLSSQLHQKRSRLTSLEQLSAKYEGFDRGTAAIMKEQGTRWGIRGLMADAVQAPPELEAVVEAVMGERLGAILCESQEVGVDGITHLRKTGEGRTTFVPVNRFKGDDMGRQPRAELIGHEGVRGRLCDLITFGADYKELGERMFGDVYVVDDLISALDLWRGIQGDKPELVTLEGEVVDRFGALSGGAAVDGAGVLQQKREIRELTDAVAALTEQHTLCKDTLDAMRREAQGLRETVAELGRNAHQSEMQLLSMDKDQERHRHELERHTERLNTIGRERTELTSEAEAAAHEVEEGQLELRNARDRLMTLEDDTSALGRELLVAMEALERAAESHTAFCVEVAQADEKRGQLERAHTRLGQDRAEREHRRVRLGESVARAGERQEELVRGIEERRLRIVAEVETRSGLADQVSVGRAAYEERRILVQREEGEQRTESKERDRLFGEVSRLEMKRHEISSARRQLEEVIAERYRLDIVTELTSHHLRPLFSSGEESRVKELRGLIERMGEINLHAIEEYNELDARFTFLTSQKTDLETALQQLEEAIARINKTSKERFREVFDLVNERFQQVFPRCFKGGQARLILTDEDNILESGIEIIAQPPGKKNATVELLSGGEKAMTAVALIFSIFLIKPSPFCLLDEVDAPLDEANVGRFNDLVRELTDRSQFIVITHNKRTMQIADTLYGVTMEEPGISKLVSVNLSSLGDKRTGGEAEKRRAFQVA
ncbi:MAG: chromosome segregation protein SMC [Polyangia bacterium]